ncbi:MAG: hypothetical protein QW567_00590 [Candidatus Hadarchaeales archaeon]
MYVDARGTGYRDIRVFSSFEMVPRADDEANLFSLKQVNVVFAASRQGTVHVDEIRLTS